MSYTAGNLDVVLTGLDKNASNTIDNVSNSLKTLSTSLQVITKNSLKGFNSFVKAIKNFSQIDVVNFGNKAKDISSTVLKLANSFNSLSSNTVGNLKVIANTFRSFSSISKIENLDKVFDNMDFNKVANGFNKLTTAITPFIDKIITAESSLQSLNSILTKISGKKLSSLTNFTNNTNVSNIGLLGKLGKRLFTLAMAKRLGQALANIVQAGTDFTETLNLWQVAMRGNLDLADEFIKKMNKAYGISQNTLMNAQATFKNMIGSLGQISDSVSYQLSESILQMALDFSSLYNVTFESAITKFEAMLAGQVRPIRSKSGLDITETTLYQMYQQIGGTKTMRQLNITEKRLLSILSVYEQMSRAGAVGDLAKTLDNFANQSRMLSENFKELKTYVGLFFQDLLQSWGVLKYINAGLIFLTEIVKGLVNYKTPNFIEGMFESTEAENEALDELQGKLLDFDKFRALDTSATTGGIAIDQTILNSLKEYQSILDNVNNGARELATKWLKDINLLTEDANGNLVINEQKLSNIKRVLEAIVLELGAIVGYLGVLSIVALVKKITTLTGAVSGLRIALAGVALALGYILVDLLLSNLGDKAKEIVAPIAMLTGAIMGLVGAILALNAVTSIGKTIASMTALAGVGVFIAGLKTQIQSNSIPSYAVGASDIDSGTVFRAGEGGKTEMVYSGSNGKTNVANVKQMKMAFYQALEEYGANHKNDDNQPIVITLDGEVVYKNTTAHAKRRGEHWSK